MNGKRLSLNVIANFLAFLINFVINFYLAPYILSTLGTEAYGFLTLANNIIGYINIISIALNSFAGRFIFAEYFAKDYKKSNYYYNSILAANILLSTIILVPVLILIIFLQYVISIPANLVSDVKWLFLIVAINYILTLIGTTFTVGTFVKNRLDLDAFRKMISYIIKALMIIVLFKLFDGSIIYVGLGTLAASLYVIIVNFGYTKKLAPELHVNIKQTSHKAIRELTTLGVWNSINSLGNTLNTGLDLLFANWFFSSTQMGYLSVGKTVSNMFASLFFSISSVFDPILMKLYSENKGDDLKKQLNFSIRFLGLFTSISFAGFFTFGLDFLNLWVPHQDTELIYKLSVIILLGDLIPSVVTPLYYVNTLTKNVKIPSLVTTVCGMCNVIGMLILIKMVSMEIYAIVLPTLIINIGINIIFVPMYAAHQLHYKKTVFYLSLMRYFVACALNMCIFSVLYKLVDVCSWLTLAVYVVLFAVIGAVSNVIVLFSNEERGKIIDLVKYKMHGKS